MSVRFFVSNMTRRVTKRETLWRAFLARRHRASLVAVDANHASRACTAEETVRRV